MLKEQVTTMFGIVPHVFMLLRSFQDLINRCKLIQKLHHKCGKCWWIKQFEWVQIHPNSTADRSSTVPRQCRGPVLDGLVTVDRRSWSPPGAVGNIFLPTVEDRSRCSRVTVYGRSRCSRDRVEKWEWRPDFELNMARK